MRINENKASQQGESRKELHNKKDQFTASKKRTRITPWIFTLKNKSSKSLRMFSTLTQFVLLCKPTCILKISPNCSQLRTFVDEAYIQMVKSWDLQAYVQIEDEILFPFCTYGCCFSCNHLSRYNHGLPYKTPTIIKEAQDSALADLPLKKIILKF